MQIVGAGKIDEISDLMKLEAAASAIPAVGHLVTKHCMKNKRLAYVGLLLVLAGLLSLIGVFAIRNNVGWQIRDDVTLGAIAVCFVGSVVVLFTMPCNRTRRAVAVLCLLLAVVVFLFRAFLAFEYMGSLVNDDFVTLWLGPAPGVAAGCLVTVAMICMILPGRTAGK